MRLPAFHILHDRRRLNLAGDLQPGPGEYALAGHIQVCSTAINEPAFTIPGGRGIGNSESLVSTALLIQTARSLHANAPAYHVGERTPGPSDYRADSRVTSPGKPAYTIAGRQNHAGSKHSTPGPGAYAVRSNSKVLGSHPNAPGFSMPVSGRSSEQSHKLPGPGGKSQASVPGAKARHAKLLAKHGTLTKPTSNNSACLCRGAGDYGSAC